jgi:hypothetical protein
MSADGFLHQRSKNYGKIPYEMMTDLTLSHGAVRLYAYMHWRYGSNNKNFESQRSMADAMGVSRRTITKYVAELEQGDWIVVIERSNQRGRESNFYHVFEFQEDCHRWREGHQRPKPEREAVERKPRQGVGGAPSHGRNGNSSSPSYQTGNTNSSSHTPANSSSHTPANSSSQQYPDSRIIQDHEEPDSSPNGDSDAPNGATRSDSIETTVIDIHKTDGERPNFDVYIGRQSKRAGLGKSKWANPFRVADEPNPKKRQFATAQEAVEKYREWLLMQPDLIAAIPELVGQVLGCWCDQTGDCHGQVLADLANRYAAGELDLDAMVAEAERRKEANRPIHVQIIDAWYGGMPAEIPRSMRNYSRNSPAAVRIADGGFTPEQVLACARAKSGEDYWKGRQVPLETIEKDLPLWVTSAQPKDEEPDKTTYDPSWAALSPVEQARRKQRESLAMLERIKGVKHERLSA